MTRARMRSSLAAEWEAMGWEWDLQIGGLILDQVADAGRVDPVELAADLPGGYLDRYGASRDDLAGAISRAIGGETIEVEAPGQPSVSVTVLGDSYSLKLGDNAQIAHSAVNLGQGTQINLDTPADRGDLVRALRALIASGLIGEWDEQAARAIGGAIEQSGALSLADIRAATVEAGGRSGADASRVQGLIEKVAVGGFGTFLATGLAAGLSDLLHMLG